MKSINTALFRFWGQFGVAAYLAGQVPDDASFPYITFDPVAGDAFGTSILTAHSWHRERTGESVNAERATLLDAIAEAIPTKGVRLPLERGFMVLRRNADNFQSYYDDPEAADIKGGRTSYEVYYYTF